MRTNLTVRLMMNNINNKHVVIEMDTEINVPMEMKLRKISLNHDICKSQ